jgi:hypothetical protein
MKRHIGHPRVEGTASRQAHCDLPPGTFEREMSKEGFFGPAAFFHHRHPPTGWSSFEGPLRPHAFDLTRHDAIADHPWAAAEILYNAHCRIRFWRTAGRMDGLARNADGDELLFVHQGRGELFCDFGHLPFESGGNWALIFSWQTRHLPVVGVPPSPWHWAQSEIPAWAWSSRPGCMRRLRPPGNKREPRVRTPTATEPQTTFHSRGKVPKVTSLSRQVSRSPGTQAPDLGSRAARRWKNERSRVFRVSTGPASSLPPTSITSMRVVPTTI